MSKEPKTWRPAAETCETIRQVLDEDEKLGRMMDSLKEEGD